MEGDAGEGRLEEQRYASRRAWVGMERGRRRQRRSYSCCRSQRGGEVEPQGGAPLEAVAESCAPDLRHELDAGPVLCLETRLAPSGADGVDVEGPLCVGGRFFGWGGPVNKG